MAVTQDVLEHAEHIQEARQLLGFSEVDHPTDLYLALTHIESRGEELPDEDDSYRYWLQIGTRYLLDAKEWAKKHRPEQARLMPDEADITLFNAGPTVNYMIAMCYFERWAPYHGYDPYRMAGMHKGGVGSAAQVTRRIRKGMSAREAHRWVALNFKRPNGKPWVPRIYLYVYGEHTDGSGAEYRFSQAFDDYSDWCDEHETSLITPERDAGVEAGQAVGAALVPEWIEQLLARGLRLLLRGAA